MIRLAIIAALAGLSGCETLGFSCVPTDIAKACIEEARINGELPSPRLGPACAKMESWMELHHMISQGVSVASNPSESTSGH